MSKRVNFSIDFDDKELFEKSVKEAIEAEVKTISRDLLPKMIEAEITRLVKAKLDSSSVRSEVEYIAKREAGKYTENFNYERYISDQWEKNAEWVREKVLSAIDKKAELIIKENVSKSILDALFSNK